MRGGEENTKELKKCRLHVLDYHNGNYPWAKYYIAFPPNLVIPDLKRPWMFQTKESSLARWSY